MPQVRISKDTMFKVRAFRKVIDAVIGEGPKEDSDYVEIIVQIGLERMLQDILPKEEPIGLKTMTAMFNRDPQFVSDFVAERIAEGGRAKENADKTKGDWGSYVT